MRIRATIQQQCGHVVVIVIEADHQRSDAFRRRHIHIGAGTDQRLDAVRAAVARGIQQGGQSSDGTVLSAGLRGQLVRPVRIQSASLDVGALGQQQLRHLGRVFRRGDSPHQRSLVLKLLNRIDVGAGFDQHLDDGQFPRFDRQHQSGLAALIRTIDSRAGIQQHLHHPGVGQLDRFGKRGGAELIDDVHCRLLRDQRVDQLVVHLVDRPMDRAGAVWLRFIHIRSGANPVERRLPVSGLNEIGQGTPGLTNGRRNGSKHADTRESETLHAVSPTRHWGPACRGAPTYPWPRHTGTCTDRSMCARGPSERHAPACPWGRRLPEPD